MLLRALLLLLLFVGVLCGALGASDAYAQDPLYQVNTETKVRALSFRFADSQTFPAERLKRQISTQAPGSWAWLRRTFDVLPGIRSRTYPFDPITLQKDVVRLERFYQQNGFLQPRIDYPISQYDAASNTIHVIFTVQEGPPLIIQDTGFFGKNGKGYAVHQFSGDLRKQWVDFRDEAGFRIGERYTEFNRIQIEDQIRSWLLDRGFAFATVGSDAQIDSTANAVDIGFAVDAGPRARFGTILVDTGGTNGTVDDAIVLRELPFTSGDIFSASALTRGQREIFSLDLFRVALAEIYPPPAPDSSSNASPSDPARTDAPPNARPPRSRRPGGPTQPRDSTVDVRYQVRLAKLRTLSGQGGYGSLTGISGEGSWTHRNFFGDARTFRANLTVETGLATLDGLFDANDQVIQPRRYRASLLLRQPYFFRTNLSSTIEPFLEERRRPELKTQASDRFLGLNERQFGVNTSLVYEILPFRTITLQHSYARTQQFVGTETTTTGIPSTGSDVDLFNKSILSLSGTFGRSDDFVNPGRGFLVRPSLDIGGRLLRSDVSFRRVRLEVSGYQPLTGSVDLAARLFAGTIRPRGTSLKNLTVDRDVTDPERLQANFGAINRFSDFLFYAGGGTDVRGWRPDQAGGKFLSRVALRDTTAGLIYQPRGAQTKLGANVEVRLPFPGLSTSWRTALFLDAALVKSGDLRLVPSPSVTSFADDPIVEPDGTFLTSPSRQVLIGTGGGIRYQTPVGFLRIDLAVKLTPDRLDLRRPETVVNEFLDGPRTSLRAVSKPELRFFGLGTGLPQRSFRLHFGIGRSF